MTFEEVMNRVIDVLQQEERISYRAIQRRFHLDEAYIEDLKIELIEAKKLAKDENGRILVLVKNSPTTAESPLLVESLGSLSAIQSSSKLSAQEDSSLPVAERRQITVLFCDLVDSTRLSHQLDPEDFREVISQYQATCVAVINHFDGYVAQYLGDGLLVYFGYPRANEDDAQRAVRAGLGILDAMETCTPHPLRSTNVCLAVRIGIHTGLVVIGEMGSGGRHEHLALGETPNLAARLQGLAQPNTVVISEATSRISRGYFKCHDLGLRAIKGLKSEVYIYQVLGENTTQSRLDTSKSIGFTPLVGREKEVNLLRKLWEQSRGGSGQVVVLDGEAGIGKSRLVQVISEQIVGTHTLQLTLHCSPYHTNSALYPVIEYLHRLLCDDYDTTVETQIITLENKLQSAGLPLSDAIPLMAALLSLPLPDIYSPTTTSLQSQKQKTLETLVNWLLAEATDRSVLTICEDLHWADPSTLELLALLLERVPRSRLMMVLTHRPVFCPPWPIHSFIAKLTLTQLTNKQVEEMVLRLTKDKPLPKEGLRQIVKKTDGIPLFVEELVKTVLESGLFQEEAEEYVFSGPLLPLAIPNTLQDALMARLDRLAPIKAVAQLCAILGREFSYALLHAVAHLDEAKLQSCLTQLVEAELLFQRGEPPQATYLFKHALVQDAAYQSLLRSTRQQYHQRIAQVMETQFSDICETQPELLAQHYTEARLNEQAVVYWQQAGKRAIQYSAHIEAINHLEKGLALLKTLPNTPDHPQQELLFLTDLGQALMITKGQSAPETGALYAQARELCRQVGESPQLFPVLWGLWYFYLVRAEFQTSRELAEQLLALTDNFQDSAYCLVAHRALGNTLFWLGEFAHARVHLEKGLDLYDSKQHASLAFLYGQDLSVTCQSWTALTLWLLGYPDQALKRIHGALSLARELDHPLSLAYALDWAAMVHRFRSEADVAQEYTEAAITISTEGGFAFYSIWGKILRGWTLIEQGQETEGIEQILKGLTAYRGIGGQGGLPYHFAQLAEGYKKQHQINEGLDVLAEALTAVEKTDECFYEAEIHRLKGEFLFIATNEAEAEVCFHRALDVSRHQQARSLELRAAVSLSRLWQHQGRHAKAYRLLAPVYDWFSEGFSTKDLREAKMLLDDLEREMEMG